MTYSHTPGAMGFRAVMLVGGLERLRLGEGRWGRHGWGLSGELEDPFGSNYVWDLHRSSVGATGGFYEPAKNFDS